MNRKQLIDEANAKRPQGAPPVEGRFGPSIPGPRMTKARIEQLIFNADVRVGEGSPEAIPPTTGALLARLNVLRVKSGTPALKRWAASRALLEAAITAAEVASRNIAPVTSAPTKIADGAETTKYKTKLHTNKLLTAVEKMNAREAREKKAAQKRLAASCAKAHGFTKVNVLDYITTRDIAAGAFNVEAFKDWIAKRDGAGLKPDRRRSALKTLAQDIASRTKQPVHHVLKWLRARSYASLKDLPKAYNPDLRKFIKRLPVAPTGSRTSSGVTPGDIATATGKDARSVRIILRRIEATIPKTWRIEGERWGFKTAHKADIIKLISQ